MPQVKTEQSEGVSTPKKQLPEALEKNKWVKGQSGNPAGRPKGSVSVIDTIRHIWEAEPERFQEFVDKYLKDPRNRQHIVEMIDGKPRGSETNVAVQVNTFTGSPEQNKELDDELINMGLCEECLIKARKYMNL